MDQSPPPVTAPSPPRPPTSDRANTDTLGEAIRRAVTVAVLFIAIFLFVRTFALEPFGVPTGSMAPKLIGNHRETSCPRCNHRVVVGEVQGLDRPADACCPNCGKRSINLDQTWEIPGDRLLVDKNVFNVRTPRRWEVAVFRCPVDISKPYVKRTVGLPGETIQLVGGDVFINGELERKSWPELREMRIPIFSHSHTPAGTWKDRWLVESTADQRRTSKPQPANEEVLRGTEIHLDATSAARPAIGLTYRHWDFDEQAERPITDWLAYNGPPKRGRSSAVHDFVFTCTVEIASGAGSFACRLGDGLDSVNIEFPIDLQGQTKLAVDKNEKLARQTAFQMYPGRTYRLEFSFVDRRAMLSVDGVELLAPLDVPTKKETYTSRGQVSRPLQLGVRGVCVVLRDVRLWRDIHYRDEGINGTNSPHQLAATEFFMLGDNSSNSLDSREWNTPGVPWKDFIGKPFLIHQPLKASRVNMNGGTKSFQTVDWDRLGWVR